jgi:hypothetical protein
MFECWTLSSSLGKGVDEASRGRISVLCKSFNKNSTFLN